MNRNVNFESHLVSLVVSRKSSLLTNHLINVVAGYSDKQVIVYDINRTWQPENIGERMWFIRPSSKNELICSLNDIEGLISPRLKLIVIDGITNLLRDFQGREAKQYIKNSKVYVFLINLLKNVAEKYNIPVIIGSYTTGIENQDPIMKDVVNYFRLNIIDLDK